jgi:hypothetical protein
VSEDRIYACELCRKPFVRMQWFGRKKAKTAFEQQRFCSHRCASRARATTGRPIAPERFCSCGVRIKSTRKDEVSCGECRKALGIHERDLPGWKITRMLEDFAANRKRRGLTV